MDLSRLEPGHVLVDEAMTISAAACAAYRAAVEDETPQHLLNDVVPCMAVAAKALAAVLRAIDLPAGTVHTSQELEFAATVAPGSALHAKATIAQNSVRRGTRFIAVDFAVTADGDAAVRGRTSLAIAEAA
ncbi:MAG: hypothetical protein FJ318_07465 [SAR202 cluster bacterium]|nr:hypothetical protein [SAR202 cluster bacterium]